MRLSAAVSSLPSKTARCPLLSLLQKLKTRSQILQIHARLIISGLMSNIFVASRLIAAISEFPPPSDMTYAELVFNHISHPNSFIYNTIIRGHTLSSDPRQGLVFYLRMRGDDVCSDKHTYPFVLKACGLASNLEVGRGVHSEVIKSGFCWDAFVQNTLISMYCRCGQLDLGRKVFDEMPDKDLVSWNSMVYGYAEFGKMGDAQRLFDEMPEKDVFSWAIMIDGYGKKAGDVVQARKVFDEMPKRDLASWNSMIDGYATLGDMISAQALFEEMPERNVISWSILIDGYVKHGNSKVSLNLFQRMLLQGIKPDKVSIVGAISACAQLGALNQGQWIHFYIKRNNIHSDIVVQTALADMYMKCGSLDDARAVFKSMLEKNAISWNVMIVGLGMNGQGEEALELFSQMEREGTQMDDLTFLGALTACTHSGQVTRGLQIFEMMEHSYGFMPKVEHYGCIIDLLGRAGRFDEAKKIIETMPMEPTSALWGSILASCRIHRNVDLVEAFAEKLMDLEKDDCGVYVLLSNAFAEKGMWNDVFRVRKLICERGMKKEAGRSVIEVNGMVHEFVNGISSHSQADDICSVISYLSEMLVSE